MFTLKRTSKFTAVAAVCLLIPLAAAQTQPTANQTHEANVKAYIDMLRKDLAKDKVAILNELMDMDPADAAKFWPVYNEYDTALTKLKDERLVFLRMYAENFQSLDGPTIEKIANGIMDVEVRKVQLNKQFFQRMSQALTSKDALRWLHIEAQIERLADLQILAGLPIVE